jgi:DNA polymerase
MDDRLDANSMRRQIQGHLQSMRAAGVEWLPRGEPIQLARSEPSPTGATAASVAIPIIAAAPLLAVAEAADAATLTLEQRREALKALAQEVKGCTRCKELCSSRTQTVFADGQAGAELCFVGEAPGADEDAQGLPFVGAAGQFLNKIITGSGLKREEVYICNILKCRPPGNRTPLPNEAANCRSFLVRQLELVRPKYICALGGCAATNLLQTTLSLGKLRGKFHDWRGIPVMVTYHPAYLLPHRSPEKKRDVWEDMKMLLRAMGRPIPITGS